MAEAVAQAKRDRLITERSIREQLIELAVADPDAAADIIDSLKTISFEPLTFFPILVGVEWKAQVSASVGYDRTEKYTEYVRNFEREYLDSDDKYGAVKYRPRPTTSTQIVTDWTPFLQDMTGTVEIAFPAVPVSGQLAHALQSFSWEGAYLGEELPPAAKIMQADPMDTLLKRHGKPLLKSVRQQVEGHLPGDRKRDIRYSPNYTGWIRFIPIWQAVVPYADSKLSATASALNQADLLFDIPKDKELIALRAWRRGRAFLFILPGILLGAGSLIGVLFAKANISSFSFISDTAFLLSTVTSAGLLFGWPLNDRTLTLKIRDRLAANGSQRAIAAGTTDHATLRSRELKNRKSDGERRIGYGLAWLGSVGIALFGLYFVYRVLSVRL